MSTGKFDHVKQFPSPSRLHAYQAASAVVVSDDHNFDRGVQTARAIVQTVLSEHGPDRLAEALERTAGDQGLTATDLPDVWFTP